MNGTERARRKKPADATYFVILKVNIGDTIRTLTGYVDVRK